MAAATSYSTLPTNKHLSHGNPRQPNNIGSYDTGFGSLTSHSYQYQTNGHSNVHQQSSHPNFGYSKPTLTDHSNSKTSKSNEKYGTTKTMQLPSNKTMENQPQQSKRRKQNPPASLDNQQPILVRSENQISNRVPPGKQQNKSQLLGQTNLAQSEQEITKSPQDISPSDRNHTQPFELNVNATNSQIDLKPTKPTKSSMMRAEAIKKKEALLEQKRKNQYFAGKLPSQVLRSQSEDEEKFKENTKISKPNSKLPVYSHSDGEQTETEKMNRKKKSSHSHPQERKSRHDGYKTEDNSSDDEDNNQRQKRERSKSKKRTTFSDSQLPPIRHGRLPPHYDPYYDHMLPPGHPLRGRYPHPDDYPPYLSPYSRRHLREEPGDIPPYLASYHDPYDVFFDYQKRKAKPKPSKNRNDGHTDREDNNEYLTGYETERDDGAKSQTSRKSKSKNANPRSTSRKSRQEDEDMQRKYWSHGYYSSPYYDENAMLEIWRQERNDYLKKKYKPTIHDVLYSQQWAKSDGYLENQRRRALRDTQGYYFPYKKYTLKDYRDIQKLNNQNPFAETTEITIDRKERQKKRQEYGTLVERQMVDNPGARHIPPREMPPRKPWHLSGGEPQDPEAVSKRERALEYSKDQVKYRPLNTNKSRSHKHENNPNDDDDDETNRDL